MPPPQLAADAPSLDILKPVVIDLLETVRHDLDAPISPAARSLRPRGSILTNHCVEIMGSMISAAAATGGVFLGLDHQAGLLHVGPHLLTALEAVRRAAFC